MRVNPFEVTAHQQDILLLPLTEDEGYHSPLLWLKRTAASPSCCRRATRHFPLALTTKITLWNSSLLFFPGKKCSAVPLMSWLIWNIRCSARFTFHSNGPFSGFVCLFKSQWGCFSLMDLTAVFIHSHNKCTYACSSDLTGVAGPFPLKCWACSRCQLSVERVTCPSWLWRRPCCVAAKLEPQWGQTNYRWLKPLTEKQMAAIVDGISYMLRDPGVIFNIAV